MSLTKTKLCNLALSKLGSERVLLSDFDTDTGVIKDQVDLHYTPTLEELTRMHSWNCCKTRNELSPFKIKVTVDKAIESISTDQIFIVTASSNTTNVNVENTKYAKYTYYSGSATSTSEAISAGQRAVELARQDTDGADVANGYQWNLTYITASGSTINVNNGVTDSYDPSGSYLHSGSGTNITVELVKPDFEYEHQYFIPTDAIRSFYLSNSSEVYKFMKPRVDWIIENNVILTNESKAFLCYDGVPEPTAMDSLFAQAFITLLAARLAVPVTGDRSLSLSLMEEFNRVIMPEARRVNGTERLDPPTIDSEWLESTYTSNSSYSNSYPPFSQTSYGSFS